MSQPAAIPVIYVAGIGRSGSTLLALLLNSHPQICSPGEMAGYKRYRARHAGLCSCKASLHECPYWAEVSRRMAGRGLGFAAGNWRIDYRIGANYGLWRLFSGPLGNGQAERVRDWWVRRLPWTAGRVRDLERRNRALMEVLLEMSGKTILADTSKNASRAGFLARLPWVDLRLIHLVRDPRGYLASQVRRGGHAQLRPISMSRATGTYRRRFAEVRRVADSMDPARTMTLRYEDLCADPPGQLRRIAAFASVQPWPTWPIAYRSGDHHLLGNPLTYRPGDGIVHDERWKRELSAEQVRYVMARTARARKFFGYE
ncbi:MAG: hypothetical protein BIFFINMI_03680 [Phycisphaerae bacterium]|nr:hypothetical protein [Phycisphaerae bacterium]